MASTAKPTSIAESTGRRAKDESGVVEIDATFGRMLGLAEGQKVGTYGDCDESWLKKCFRWASCYT